MTKPRNTTAKSPQIEWLFWNDYKLKNLKKDFKIADFERIATAAHVKEITEAILDNTFFDNVIRVVKKGKKFVVIDAQHRTQALWLAYHDFGVQSYDLVIAVYEKEFARRIYRNLNLGKKLTSPDHMRSLDDKTVPFFNELRDIVSHLKGGRRMGFFDVAQALHYTRGNKHTLQPKQLEDFLVAVTDEEIELSKLVINTLWKFGVGVAGNPLYRMVIFRNLFKIAKERKLTEDKLYDLADTIGHDDEFIKYSAMRTQEDLVLVHFKIRRLLDGPEEKKADDV